MSRLTSTLGLDLLLQLRYGFYYAAAFVTPFWIAMLLPLPDSALKIAVPLVVFAELAIIGYYFIAGMVLFEKGERTLYALVCTPLRFGEYLVSKLTTLTMMAVVSSLVVVVAGYGIGFELALFVPSVMFISLIALLVGFISVLPFDSITRYLLPSQPPLAVMSLPLIPFLDLWQSPAFYLIPTHGALLLLSGAFGTVSLAAWQILYAALYQFLWVCILIFGARLAFDRYVVRRGG